MPGTAAALPLLDSPKYDLDDSCREGLAVVACWSALREYSHLVGRCSRPSGLRPSALLQACSVAEESLAAIERTRQVIVKDRYLASAASNEESEYKQYERAYRQKNSANRDGHRGPFLVSGVCCGTIGA